MKAVMLVGGLGTRLRPLTLEVKKELMPVAGRPFLEHVLANLSDHGVEEVILTTGHMAEAFEAYPAEQAHGVKLTISHEAEPLDTCGAVKNVEHLLDDTFLVLNADILTDLDVTELVSYHRERETMCTITLTAVDDPTAYGLVPTDEDGRIERFIEKPRADEVPAGGRPGVHATNLINAGTYVLEPAALNYVPTGAPYSFERGLFPLLLAEGEALYGFVGHEYWLDIGTPTKYLRANHDCLERRVGLEPPGSLDEGSWIGKRSEIDPGAKILAPSMIEEGCSIARRSIVGPLAALGPRCRVGEGATVSEAVLHEDVEIGEGARVVRSVLGAGAVVGEGTSVLDAVVAAGVEVGAHNELGSGIRLWPGLRVPDKGISFR